MIKILVVEDELIVSMELKSRLNDLGYSVCGTVASGEEAIEQANKQEPDIILMDINIKGAYDGVQAAEIIKSIMISRLFLLLPLRIRRLFREQKLQSLMGT